MEAGPDALARVPVASPPQARLARVSALAALAIAGRLAFLWLPNVALTYSVVFLAGVLEGALVGAAVGLLAMTVTNLMLSGLHPVLIANGSAMALLGLAGGLLRPWLLRAPRDRLDRMLQATMLVAAGFFGTLLFSVAVDSLDFVTSFVLTPEGARIGWAAFGPRLLAGLVFNLVPALVNAALFAVVVPAVIEALRRTGRLAPARGAVAAA